MDQYPATVGRKTKHFAYGDLRTSEKQNSTKTHPNTDCNFRNC